MKDIDKITKLCRVAPNTKVRLKNYDPSFAGDSRQSKKKRQEAAKKVLSEDVGGLAAAQELLYASDTWSVLVIFQAMDAAGKDSTIKHVMSGVNPQGCQVFSFKHPSAEELDHNFLWRYSKALPERGRIGIFNRSYYEEVLIVKVHPKLFMAQRIPDLKLGKGVWHQRYEDINNFELHLSRNGTRIIKFFLHLSKEEQRERFLARLEEKSKNWKFSLGDMAERAYWDDYMRAFEDAISATSTAWAPWHIIPADHKWMTRALVANIITKEIKKLDLKFPSLDKNAVAEIMRVKKELKQE